MKKLILIIPAIMLATQTARAEAYVIQRPNLPLCQPVMTEAAKQKFYNDNLVKPTDVKMMLEEIRQRHDDRRMAEILGEPALRSLESYSKLNDNQVNANIYAGAAVAGAAYAVVDYVWRRTGGSNAEPDFGFDESIFDVTPGTIQPWQPKRPKQPLPMGAYQGIRPKIGGDIGPVAATPAAAGAAVVGAVAERVVGWGLRKAFGNANIPDDFRIDAFDLQNNQLQQQGY